jgi:Tol biopolymer transport system component
MKRPLVFSLAALAAFSAIPSSAASAAPDPRIVYSHYANANWDLYTMTPPGTKVAPLTSTAGIHEFGPRVSADGKHIAFRRIGGADELWVMKADGTGLAVVPGSGKVGYASWSPDGKRLAYECQEPQYPNTGHICVRDVSGANFQLLSATPGADDTAPSWSPDGTRIVWSRRIGNGSHLVVLTLKNLSLDALTPLAAGRSDYAADWSPDSKQIAFSRFDNGNGLGSSLYRIPAGGGAEKLIIAGPPLVNDTYLELPAWSPDGKTIAYNALYDDGGWSDVWTITPDGKNNTQLSSGGLDLAPDWLA